MIKRLLQSSVEKSLEHFPAVGIIGARQVGKTTLAQMIAQNRSTETIYLDLERPADYAALEEPERFLDRHTDKLVIIDEIQQRGELFPVLRSLIDKNRHPGRFLILGSSSPDLMRQSGESLAGRISYHELSAFLLSELPKNRMDQLWIRGGFPESALAVSEEISVEWRESFVMTYLQKDLSAMGYDIRIPPMTLRRMWQMLAHTHGQLANLSKLAANLELSRQSIRRYLDILQETFMIRILPPYHVNLKKRIVKSSKIYLRDSGLLHTLLAIKNLDDLMGRPVVGASWEGFCLEQIINRMPRGWEAFFYRTQAHAEVDLVLQAGFGQPPILVEFKHSQSPKPTKGFWSAREDLQPQACYVVYPGEMIYPLPDSVEALPLTHIHQIWEKAELQKSRAT